MLSGGVGNGFVHSGLRRRKKRAAADMVSVPEMYFGWRNSDQHVRSILIIISPRISIDEFIGQRFPVLLTGNPCLVASRNGERKFWLSPTPRRLHDI